MEYYDIEKLKREILSLLGKYLDMRNYRVFFFGSRVTGAGTDRSDIDVGIEGPSVPGHVLMAIQEEISSIRTLYKIDIVDFTAVGDKFRAVVGNNREYISS